MENSISSLKLFEMSFIETILFIYLNEAFRKHQVTYHTRFYVTSQSQCCRASEWNILQQVSKYLKRLLLKLFCSFILKKLFQNASYLSYNHFRHFLVPVLWSFRMENSISSLRVFEASFFETILLIYLKEAFSKFQVTYHTTFSVTFQSQCFGASEWNILDKV